jgi:hypothetical protein
LPRGAPKAPVTGKVTGKVDWSRRLAEMTPIKPSLLSVGGVSPDLPDTGIAMRSVTRVQVRVQNTQNPQAASARMEVARATRGRPMRSAPFIPRPADAAPKICSMSEAPVITEDWRRPPDVHQSYPNV